MPQNLPFAAKPLTTAPRLASVVLRQWLDRFTIFGFAGVAMLLVWRRAAGALSQPLGRQALVVTVAGVLLLRLMAHRHAIAHRWKVANHAAMTAMGLLILAAIWLPASPWERMLPIAAIWVVAELICWRQVFDSIQPVPVASPIPVPSGLPTTGYEEESSDEFDPSLVLRTERHRQPDGSETIFSTLQARFAVGQRTTDLHLSFCPPLAALPNIEVEAVDGPSARVKVTQLLPIGLRLEVRLDGPASEPTNVAVQVLATLAESRESVA